MVALIAHILRSYLFYVFIRVPFNLEYIFYYIKEIPGFSDLARDERFQCLSNHIPF